MPVYTCPHCHEVIIRMTVFAKEPKQVTCPHCGRRFNPRNVREVPLADSPAEVNGADLADSVDLALEHHEHPSKKDLENG